MARRNEIYPGTSIFREDLSGAGRKNGSSVTVIRRRSYVRAGRQPNNGNSAMARRNENISRYKYIPRRLIRCGQKKRVFSHRDTAPQLCSGGQTAEQREQRNGAKE